MKKGMFIIKAKGLVFLSLIMVLSLFLSACNVGSATVPDEDGEVTWKLNHIRPAGTRTDISAKQFSEDVYESTEGRVNIEVYNNSQLGDYQLVQESVALGEVDMQLATLGTNVDRTLQVAITPYLVSNYDEARELYNSEDGMLNQYFKEQLEEQNIKLLAVYPQYFGSVFLAEEADDVKNPDGRKGVKVRVPAMKSFEEFGEAIGFVVTPLASSDIFTSLQTGIVDGAIGGGTELYYNEYGELGEQILPINTHFEAHYLTVNKDAFEALKEEDQNSILEFAKTFEEDAFKQAEEEQGRYNELISEEHGVEIVEFSDEEIQAYADKVRAEVWPELEDEYGEILNEVKKELDID